MSTPPIHELLEEIIVNVVDPAAADVDQNGTFPHEAMSALGKAGLLGLLSSPEVGGRGGWLGEAAQIIRRLAARCGSTASVLAMHYCAAVVIEQLGDDDIRRAVGAGQHLSTLAFAEAGTEGNFWTPSGTATLNDDGDGVFLNATKGSLVSAGAADSYIWSSLSVEDQTSTTLWLVPSELPGLETAEGSAATGMCGSSSKPVVATDVLLPVSLRLGEDGAGVSIIFGALLPLFQILNASLSLGLMDAAVSRAINHVASSSLSEQQSVRRQLAQMKNRADVASTLVSDAIVSMATDRVDASLRMLQTKTVAGEAALEVTEMATRLGETVPYADDVAIDRPFRNAQAASVSAPTTIDLQDFIGRALCGMPLFD